MRVILLESEEQYFPSTPLSLTPILGKPFLERVIEYWVNRGGTHFEIFLSQAPQRTERKLGDGSRWGVKVRYHLTQPSRLLRSVDAEEPVILGRLADFPPPQGLETVSCLTLDEQGEWTGWVHASLVRALQVAQMRQTPSGLTRVYHPSRRLGSEESFLAQQLFFLRHGCVEARELEPGVWVAPGAEVHPSARLLGPVYIGQNSVVGRLACIGPGVVVDRDSWVGDRCQLADCWVRPQTMLASGRRALGDLLGEEYRPRPDWLTRGIALFLLLLTWPVLLLRPIQRRPVAVSREREELLGVSPLPAALAEVVMGRMDLLGRRPRSLSDMQRVPQDWWLTLMSTPPGLWGGHQTDEADLFFCALRGWDRWRHVLTSVR